MYPMRTVRSLTAVLLTLLFSTAAHAQNLGETLSTVGEEYAQLYVDPLIDALGADLNTGLFHTADVGGGLLPAIDIYAGAKIPATLVSASDKTFDLTYQDTQPVTVQYQGRRYTVQVPVTYRAENAPTVFGTDEAPILTAHAQGTATVVDDQGNTHEVPYDTTLSMETIGGLVDTEIAPIVVPHVSVGSVFGTDIMIRYLPEITQEDYGSLTMWGLGIRHDIDQHIPGLPVDIAVQAGTQNISIADDTNDKLANVNAYAVNAAVSKTFHLLTVYGGLQWESSTVDVNYTIQPVGEDAEPVPISFTQKGANQYRLLAGVSFGLGPVVINADYSVGNLQVVSAGIGLGL